MGINKQPSRSLVFNYIQQTYFEEGQLQVCENILVMVFVYLFYVFKPENFKKKIKAIVIEPCEIMLGYVMNNYMYNMMI